MVVRASRLVAWNRDFHRPSGGVHEQICVHDSDIFPGRIAGGVGRNLARRCALLLPRPLGFPHRPLGFGLPLALCVGHLLSFRPSACLVDAPTFGGVGGAGSGARCTAGGGSRLNVSVVVVIVVVVVELIAIVVTLAITRVLVQLGETVSALVIRKMVNTHNPGP